MQKIHILIHRIYIQAYSNKRKKNGKTDNTEEYYKSSHNISINTNTHSFTNTKEHRLL